MPKLTPTRWKIVSRILERMGRFPPAEREARREQVCDSHPSLEAEVERLHRHYDYDLTFDPQPEGFSGLELIGRGGMSVVFSAYDEVKGRQVALKFLDPELIGTAEERRFKKEHGFLQRLRSPSVPKVYGLRTTTRGEPYLVMELINGKPVHEHCAWHGLTVRERVQLFTGVCAAVGSLHARGVIHRDLSPRNILVDAEGKARIIDFGTARAADPGDARVTLTVNVPRTPLYSSPEQIRGERPTFATDVYSLGLILFELLSEGESPYGLKGDESITEVERAILTRPPTRPSATGLNPVGESESKLLTQLDEVVLRCLSKDPGQRYRDAAALQLQLRRVASGVSLAPDPLLRLMTADAVLGRGLRRLAGLLSSPRFIVGFLVSAAIGAALLAWIGKLVEPTFGPALDAKIDGNSVRLLAEDGQEKIVSFRSAVSRAFLRDLDGDGRNECFVATGTKSVDHSTLWLLDASGSRIDSGWPYKLDVPDPYPGPSRTDMYGVNDVAVLTLDGRPHVAALFFEDTYWRSALVLLDADGQLRGHLWHPGRLLHVRTLGRRLVVAGQNNRLEDSDEDGAPDGTRWTPHVFFAIDPEDLGGEAPPYCGTSTPNRSFSWYYRLTPTRQDARLEPPQILPPANFVKARCGRRFFFDATGVTGSLDDDFETCPEGLTLTPLDLARTSHQ